MASLSSTLNKEEIQKIKEIISPYEVPSTNGFVSNFYRYKGSTITLYKTSVLVIQGNNANEIYKELFGFEYKTNDFDKQDILFEQKEVNQNYIATIGSDEVGVGDFFGGIVVASAYVNKDQINWLKEIGVKDSKNLSDEKMKEIYERIKDVVPHVMYSFYPSKYNELYEEYENSHVIKAIGHNQCLWDLSKKVTRPYFVIIDQFANQTNYSNYLRQANRTEFTIDIFETKAENKYLSVACASIIARVHFLEQIKDLESELEGIKLPLGSSNEEIKHIAKQIIDKFGIDKLNNLVKQHFITYNEIIGE